MMSALILQHPSVGLLALLGVLLPVAIHLWNRRPGQLVQVGSLRWLSVAANRRMRSLKLEQLLLLLLRAAIVAVLALALTDPIRQTPPPPRHGQVLVSPDLLNSASLTAVRTTIDSLRKQGYELRQLAPSLPMLSATQWRHFDSLATTVNTLRSFEPSSDNLWARVQQAADSLPERPLRVFTFASQHSFQGTRPALPAAVRWQTVPQPNSDAQPWLQAAYKLSADSLRLLLGTSNEAATTFRTVAVRVPAAGEELRVAGLPTLRYEARSGGQAVLRPVSGRAVPVQTAALRIAIYHDAAHAQDAKYLRAALRAASLGLPAAPALTVSTTAPTSGQQLDWLFWLSEAPVPAAWQKSVAAGLQLWQEASAPGIATEAMLAQQASLQPIRLLRRDTLTASAGTALWSDGLGQSVLTRAAEGKGARYHLHTRFHPAWSELGSNAELPALLLPLLQPDPLQAGPITNDRRTLAPTQVFTTQHLAPSPTHSTANRPRQSDLRPWVILLAALLFGLERLLVRRRAAALATTSSE